MPKPKARAKTKSKPRRARQPKASRTPTFAQLVDDLMQAGQPLAEATDPLDAELFGSLVVDMLEPERDTFPERRFELVERLIDALPARRNAGALAILLALAAVVPDLLAARARSAAWHLEVSGIPVPAWAASIGKARFVEAWAATDEFGDQDLIVASFQHPGYEAHAISLTADHNFHGLFRQAAVGVDPDAVRRAWAEVASFPLKPMTARDLAGRWAAGTGMYRVYLDPPVYDDVPRVMAFLEARASALPEPPPPAEERPPLSDEDRRALIDRFLASSRGSALETDRAGPAALVVDLLIDFREGHGEGDLLRWSPIVAEIAMLDWLPRKAVLSDEEIDAVPDVLRAFVSFAAEQKGLAEADLDETLVAIDHFEPDFRQAMADDDEFGPGKRLAQQMEREGVDMSDPEALQRWIADFNQRPLAARDDILGPMT